MQYKPLLLSLLTATLLSACSVNLNINDTQLLGTEWTDEDEIKSVMTAQEAAWNAGDIDGFMDAYWQSPNLRFASGGTITRGWQATRDRYHAHYSDRALMGELSFDDLDVSLLGSDDAIVHGAWALQREADRPSGLFTLVFEKQSGEWKIVSDTTTSAD